MNYIKGATDYLGLTETPSDVKPLVTSASGSGAVSANDLMQKKNLNEEILAQKGTNNLNSTMPDTSAKRELNNELLSTERSDLLNGPGALPNTAAKQELNTELLNTNKSDLLQGHLALPNTSAKQELNNELLRTDKNDLLNHGSLDYDSELRRENEPGLSLRAAPQNLNERSLERDSAILPPQMASGTSNLQSNFGNQSNVQSTLQSNRLSQGFTTARAAPVVMETIQKDTVIHERIHPMQKEEIQPIIYREREQLDVKQVTQMMHETQIQPTLVQQRELPAQTREAIIERGAPIPENYIASTREINATARSQVVHAPIVEETIRKTVVQEIQPVLERDVFAPVSVQTTQPIYEKIIEAPVVYRETRDVQELGTRQSTGFIQQEMVLQQQNEFTQLQQVQAPSSRRLSVNSQDVVMRDEYARLNSLPTGQVLPNVASARPAWAYLPADYAEKRPDFIGTSSQYALAANGLNTNPEGLQKGLYNPYAAQPQPQTQMMNPAAPLNYRRQ